LNYSAYCRLISAGFSKDFAGLPAGITNVGFAHSGAGVFRHGILAFPIMISTGHIAFAKKVIGKGDKIRLDY